MIPAPAIIPLTPVSRESVVSVKMESTPGGVITKTARHGLASSRVPVLHCSVCMINAECPEYREGYVCAFDEQWRLMPTRSLEDVTTLAAQVLEENVLRLKRARLKEDMVLGGEVDPKTTLLSKAVMQQAKQVAELLQSRRAVTVEAKGEGILSRVFGGMLKEVQPVIEVTGSEE